MGWCMAHAWLTPIHTAYRLYSVETLPIDFILLTVRLIQTLAVHPTFWNVNTVLIFHAAPAVSAPIWV